MTNGDNWTVTFEHDRGDFKVTGRASTQQATVQEAKKKLAAAGRLCHGRTCPAGAINPGDDSYDYAVRVIEEHGILARDDIRRQFEKDGLLED